MNQRKSLSDILRGDAQQQLQSAWQTAQAADDFAPLPPGTYEARIEAGELETGRSKGTPGYKLTFTVVEGEYAGRRLFHDVWLTPASMPMAKRDLGKLGVTDLQQLEKPLPEGIICKLHVALRKGDDGAEFNRVKAFEVIAIRPPEPDPFAPQDDTSSTPVGGESDGAA